MSDGERFAAASVRLEARIEFECSAGIIRAYRCPINTGLQAIAALAHIYALPG
jgi:hypothetical protein